MTFFQNLLAELPDTDAVWRQAIELYGDTPIADRYAACVFEGLYRQVRDALEAIIEPDDDEPEDEIETGNPVGELEAVGA